MTLPAQCPVDESGPALWVTLDDGGTYCTVHKGLIEDAPAPLDTLDDGNAGIMLQTPVVDSSLATEVVPATEPTHVDELAPANLSTASETAGVAPDPAPDLVRDPETDNGDGAAPAPTDEGGPNFGALKLIIGLTLRAGLASLDAKNNPVEPPTGWMPPPANDIPEVEAGAAMAVALMIRTFGIDHADVIALTKQFLDTDTETETTQ